MSILQSLMDRIQTNRFKRIENFFNLIKNENEHRRLARTRIFHQTIYYGSLLFFIANFFLGHQQLQVFILFNQTTIKKMSLGQHPRLSTLCYILGLISSIVTTQLLFRPIEKPIFMILYEILVLHQNNLSSQILVTKLTDPSTPIRMQRSIRFAEWLLERSINFQFFCCTSWTIYIFILNWASPKTRLVNLIEIFCIILFTIIFRLIIETCMICALSLKLLQIYLCLELAVCNRKLQNHYSILRCRIRSKFHRPILIGKILQDFILNHHWICSMIDRISPEWSGANLLFILLNIPLNMIFVNLVYFERQKTIRIVVNTCLLLIHSTVVLIVVLVLPRINRYAHRSRITILSIDSNLIIKNGLSIRYRLKTQNYVEKLSSDRFPIGIGIGSSKAVTNFDVCKFTALYIGYFLVLFDWIRTPY